ncbi:hypothetical protein KFU94_38220 [Chloroflexi bacterium TSY]|nr:hypothetical protein [Chloroflexi bacterium TSY]
MNKQAALERYRAVGFLSGQILTLSNLAADYTQLLDFDKARIHLTEAESLARQNGLLSELQWVLFNKTQLMLERSDPVQLIESVYNEAAQLQEQLQEKHQEIIYKRLAAELALQRQQSDEAFTLAADLIKIAENEQVEDGLAYRLLGKIQNYLGNPDAAQDAYRQSESRFAETNSFEAARTQYALGKCLFHEQLFDQAESTLASAHKTFLELNCSNHVTLVEQLQTNIHQSKSAS